MKDTVTLAEVIASTSLSKFQVQDAIKAVTPVFVLGNGTRVYSLKDVQGALWRRYARLLGFLDQHHHRDAYNAVSVDSEEK